MVQSLPILEVEEYIPQRAPMIMVDALYEVSADTTIAKTGLKISSNNIFCNKNGYFVEAGILEHVAQSAALRFGYICKMQGKQVPIGFIGSFNKIKIYNLPILNDCITTTIKVEYEVIGIVLLSFEIYKDDTLCATGQIKVVLETN